MSMLEVKDLQVYYGVIQALKGISFETATIERYRRRESSVEEALIEMYLAGVSVRRVEDITVALWGCCRPRQAISHLRERILPMYRAISWYQWESPTCRRGAVCSLP